MNILIVGEGGREHALAWKAAQSDLVESIFVAPGNAGTSQEAKTQNVAISVEDIDALIKFSRENEVELCIVGPEGPLVLGIADAFAKAGIKCFGPRKAAAQLEGSKSFAKEFLIRHRIPTATYAAFSELQPAIDYIRKQGIPIVIKADGLAAGKGVIIAHSEAQAISTLEDILDNSLFGEAGASVVIEEFLQGEEASFMCMVADGRVLPFASSQDHKAAYDGDKGPNTGGMGAYTPAPVVDSAMFEKIMASVIEPTIAGLQADGLPYTGFLYAGLMIDEQGIPRVIEYNCRMGDPETQPIMMRLESDLVALCLAAVDGTLPESAEWTDRVALGVVLAAKGYPGGYEKGRKIEFDELPGNASDIKVFHAGTRARGADTVTSGGRVLCVCALADSTKAAQTEAYRAIGQINWPGMWFRNDIGYRAVKREQG
ncbi:MAG: phosphoribosylamine--glycine ligase [Proteobacteria bacterium]|nr:phosphoribosylamine--glycine ligase [Pseudomonadota bacterium]